VGVAICFRREFLIFRQVGAGDGQGGVQGEREKEGRMPGNMANRKESLEGADE